MQSLLNYTTKARFSQFILDLENGKTAHTYNGCEEFTTGEDDEVLICQYVDDNGRVIAQAVHALNCNSIFLIADNN